MHPSTPNLRRGRTVERKARSIDLRAFLIRFFHRLLKFFQLLFFLSLLAHVIRSLSFKIWSDLSVRRNLGFHGRSTNRLLLARRKLLLAYG